MKFELNWPSVINSTYKVIFVLLLNFSLTIKAVPHACVIKTSQP